jgi:predicted DsbA family dithiol-disulfide isomerase
MHEVDQDWVRSSTSGITAVPAFVLGSFNLVGAQPYEKLAEFLNGRQVPKRRASSEKPV